MSIVIYCGHQTRALPWHFTDLESTSCPISLPVHIPAVLHTSNINSENGRYTFSYHTKLINDSTLIFIVCPYQHCLVFLSCKQEAPTAMTRPLSPASALPLLSQTG